MAEVQFVAGSVVEGVTFSEQILAAEDKDLSLEYTGKLN